MDMSDELLMEFPPIKDPNSREILYNLDELGINFNFEETGPLIFKIVGIKSDGSYTAPVNSELNGAAAFMPMEDEEAIPIRKELAAVAPAGPKPSVLQKLVTARFFEEKTCFPMPQRLTGMPWSFRRIYRSFAGFMTIFCTEIFLQKKRI